MYKKFMLIPLHKVCIELHVTWDRNTFVVTSVRISDPRGKFSVPRDWMSIAYRLLLLLYVYMNFIPVNVASNDISQSWDLSWDANSLFFVEK